MRIAQGEEESLDSFREGADLDSNAYVLGWIDAVSLLWFNVQEANKGDKPFGTCEEEIKKIHVAVVKRRYKKITEFIEEGLLS